MSAVDALILALADGRTMREAAAIARIPSAQATREAREVGWPDLDAIRLAAEEIRDRHTTPPLSREETPVPPRTKHEPVPIEADVEQAITAGAALIREARASVALDRDQTHAVDEIPRDLDRLVDQDQHEAPQELTQDEISAIVRKTIGGPVWVADDVTDEQRAADVPDVASVDPIDRELMDDTAALLQTLERVTAPARPLGALNPEQRQRAVALREATDVLLGLDPVVADLLVVADYIVTGAQPAVYVSGHVTPGGDL